MKPNPTPSPTRDDPAPTGRILVVEDEIAMARLLELALTHEGYQVHVEHDGKWGLAAVTRFEPDLILLDLLLPGLSGREVCAEVRRFSTVPILMLTAMDSLEDKITGLDLGADDYMTKPFEMDELLARVRAALRGVRQRQDDPPLIAVGDLRLDPDARTASRSGQAIDLTRLEFDLLLYLARNRGIVLSRDQIITAVWGYDYEGEGNGVDVYIRYLRAKIDEPFGDKLIHTVRGVGYVLENRSRHD